MQDDIARLKQLEGEVERLSRREIALEQEVIELHAEIAGMFDELDDQEKEDEELALVIEFIRDQQRALERVIQVDDRKREVFAEILAALELREHRR